MEDNKMLGETGTEQFSVVTRVDGKVIRDQPIHDPFLHNKTTVGVGRWDLFKALFKSQFTVTVEVAVRGSEGVQRAVMMLDPAELVKETAVMLEERRISRENSTVQGYYAAPTGQAKKE